MDGEREPDDAQHPGRLIPAGSGLGVYELIVLVVLLVVIVMALRPGRSAEPLIIHRPGHYHFTLAPHLASEQTFLTLIDILFRQAHTLDGDLPGQYFTVVAKDPSRAKDRHYLLAIASRNGTLYLQAIDPRHGTHDPDTDLMALRRFSDAVLSQLPIGASLDTSGIPVLNDSVMRAAAQSGRSIGILV